MPLLTRIYYNAVFGGLGGLLGWLLYGVFSDPSPRTRESALWLIDGAVVGGCIGYFVVSVEAIRDRSLVRFCRLASYGVVLGALGGAPGAWVGVWLEAQVMDWIGFADTEPKTWAAAAAIGLGWMVLGLAVGASEGLAARSLGKFSYGTIGGTVGGFVGGTFYGRLYVWVIKRGGGKLDTQDPVVALALALGLILLGACIGSLSALVQAVFQQASVRVLRGWQEGREYPLEKLDTLLGRDEHADIALFRDMRVEKKHAIIQREQNRFIFMNNHAPAEQTLVNGAAVAHCRDLHDGDRIQLGNVILRFQMRAAQARKRRGKP